MGDRAGLQARRLSPAPESPLPRGELAGWFGLHGIEPVGRSPVAGAGRQVHVGRRAGRGGRHAAPWAAAVTIARISIVIPQARGELFGWLGAHSLQPAGAPLIDATARPLERETEPAFKLAD